MPNCGTCGGTERYPNGPCKKCHGERTKRYAKLNPELYKQARFNWKLKKYNITEEELEGLYWHQGNTCAICSVEPPYGAKAHERLQIDHCHEEGQVRGLLCGRCNRALGLFDHEIWKLKVAIQYLEKNGRYDTVGKHRHRGIWRRRAHTDSAI